MVSQLAQGNAFSRSAEGGQLADTATRSWKVILESPNEAWNVHEAVGVYIGDPYSDASPIPCVSIETRADGESRLVRIVTATYNSTPGEDDQGGDPGTVSPELRPANFSTSTTLYEMPAYLWKRDGDWEPAVNPVGDRLDGITKFEPITTIRVTQFSQTPGTVYSAYCGYVNSEQMTLGGYMTCEPHTVMFRGVEAAPAVESFGSTVYRGFMNSYEFAYRANRSEAPGASGDYGWDLAVPVTGFNCFAFTPNFVGTTDDNYAVPLKRDTSQGEFGPVLQPLVLQDGVTAGDKVRALVRVAGPGKDVIQQPSAQPIPLNENGRPRSPNATQKVIIWRVSTQIEINLTQTLSLRLQ
jgi:hypothetical protein